MKIFLVTASDYDYSLIDSAWTTREEADRRIAEAQALPQDHPDKPLYAYNFDVKEIAVGEILGETERFQLGM